MAKGHTATASAKAWPQTRVCAPRKAHGFHVTSCLSEQAEDRRRSWSGPHGGLGSAGGLAFSQKTHMCHLSHHRHPPLPWLTLPFLLRMHSRLLVIFQGTILPLGQSHHCQLPGVWGHGLPGPAAPAPTWPPASGALTSSSAAGDLSRPWGLALG